MDFSLILSVLAIGLSLITLIASIVGIRRSQLEHDEYDRVKKNAEDAINAVIAPQRSRVLREEDIALLAKQLRFDLWEKFQQEQQAAQKHSQGGRR